MRAGTKLSPRGLENLLGLWGLGMTLFSLRTMPSVYPARPAASVGEGFSGRVIRLAAMGFCATFWTGLFLLVRTAI